MKKYADKSDYTEENINMIVGVGFDDVCSILTTISQYLGNLVHNTIKDIEDISFYVKDIHKSIYNTDKYVETVACMGKTISNLALENENLKDEIRRLKDTLHKESDKS